MLQAEDGIRVGHVTGVQTCALPIFADPVGDGVRLGRTVEIECQQMIAISVDPLLHEAQFIRLLLPVTLIRRPARSEERRVGKECAYASETSTKKTRTEHI